MDYINVFLKSHSFFNNFKSIPSNDDFYRFQKRYLNTSADLIVSKDFTHISLYISIYASFRLQHSYATSYYCYFEDGKYVLSDMRNSYDSFSSTLCLELIDNIFGSKLRHEKRFHLIKEELIQETRKIGSSYYQESLQEGLKLWNHHTNIYHT